LWYLLFAMNNFMMQQLFFFNRISLVMSMIHWTLWQFRPVYEEVANLMPIYVFIHTKWNYLEVKQTEWKISSINPKLPTVQNLPSHRWKENSRQCQVWALQAKDFILRFYTSKSTWSGLPCEYCLWNATCWKPSNQFKSNKYMGWPASEMPECSTFLQSTDEGGFS
jgi:hypothetical protein